jgi:hypothetical protein
MSRFAQLPRPQFGQRALPDEKAGPVTIARGLHRRAAMLHQADQVLAHLPGPGEALHGVITGRYDLMHLLVCILNRMGAARSARLATLSYNSRNVAEMIALLDGPQPPRLTLLCSAFFRDHNRELWEHTLDEFRQRGQRAAAARSHCKVITLDLASGAKLTLEGSANLRANGNREQFALIHDAALHDWHAAWIDALVTAHEGENDADGESR